MISWIASKSKVEVVGLVGCGRMGRCMLESVLNAGYRTVACDAFPAAAAAAGEMGAEVYSTPAEVMKEADMVLMSLPGPAQLEAVLFGEDGMVRTATAGKVIVDTSTVDPGTTRKNAARIYEKTGADIWTAQFWVVPLQQVSGCCPLAAMRQPWNLSSRFCSPLPATPCMSVTAVQAMP